MRVVEAAAIVLLAGAVAPATAGAAALEVSTSVGIGDYFAVVGRDLKPADGYVLTLGAPPLPGSPSTCGARIGGARDVAGARTVFSGRVPSSLVCHLPDGTRTGRVPTAPGGGFLLSLCVPTNPALCDGDTFSSRGVRILRAASACHPVALGNAGTEDLASNIRAAGVGCRTARFVASRSKQHAARCYRHGFCSYRTRGFRCRGTVDEAEMPKVVFRCTRHAARVTFIKT